jgi:histidinol dehydrogenase
MEQQRISKQFVDFQKTAFDNTFHAMVMFQEQAERATHMFLETNPWPMPEEGRTLMQEWFQAFKRGRDEFKRAMDESFERMENFFERQQGQQEPEEEKQGRQEGQREEPSQRRSRSSRRR